MRCRGRPPTTRRRPCHRRRRRGHHAARGPHAGTTPTPRRRSRPSRAAAPRRRIRTSSASLRGVVEVDFRNAVIAGAFAAVVSGAPSTVWTLVAGGDLLASSAGAGTIVVADDAPRSMQLAAGAAVHGAISLG